MTRANSALILIKSEVAIALLQDPVDHLDTTVGAKVKAVEDRLDAVIAPVLKRLESLEQKNRHLKAVEK